MWLNYKSIESLYVFNVNEEKTWEFYGEYNWFQ